MTHEDAGRYAAKRTPGTVVDEALAAAVRDKTVQGEIACARAEEISLRFGITLSEVGAALDLLETRLTKCQLGLFGYPKEKFPSGRAVEPTSEVAGDIEAAIRGCLVAGRLPCKSAWEIAARQGIPKMAVSAACEKLKIRVKPCQLGAF